MLTPRPSGGGCDGTWDASSTPKTCHVRLPAFRCSKSDGKGSIDPQPAPRPPPPAPPLPHPQGLGTKKWPKHPFCLQKFKFFPWEIV